MNDLFQFNAKKNSISLKKSEIRLALKECYNDLRSGSPNNVLLKCRKLKTSLMHDTSFDVVSGLTESPTSGF